MKKWLIDHKSQEYTIHSILDKIQHCHAKCILFDLEPRNEDRAMEIYQIGASNCFHTEHTNFAFEWTAY